MKVRMFKGLAACSLALAALALPACTAATDAGEDGVETPEIGQSTAAVTTPHWGSFTRSNVCRSDGKRKWSAILWDIPWGASWEAACAKAKGDPNHITPRVPDKCVTSINEWGEWYLTDSTCAPPEASFVSFTTSPTRPCADGLARFSFTAHSSGTACFQLRINGAPKDIGPSVCGTGDWTGSATIDLQAEYGAHVPAELTVRGFLHGDGQTLATVDRTVTTQICN
ncbi:MAG: hypothetical protein HOO96_27285 [Polyangiaceae bacterium]|nr:hypothetical protein [Polyangiaceae bacterium]